MKAVILNKLIIVSLATSLMGGALIGCSGGKSGNRAHRGLHGDEYKNDGKTEPEKNEPESSDEKLTKQNDNEEDSIDSFVVDNVRVQIKDSYVTPYEVGGPVIGGSTSSGQQVATPASLPVMTGAIEPETGRHFIDIANDGWLLALKKKMNEEPDLAIREVSKEFAASIRRVDVHTNLETKEAIVRVGFSVGLGQPLVYAILNGRLQPNREGTLGAPLVEHERSNPFYEFRARVDCLDVQYCENTVVTIEQWADQNKDGQLEVCKRAYAIHRKGHARLTLDKDSRWRFENGQSGSQAFNRFTDYLVNTIEINEYFTTHNRTFPPVGQRPTPYARKLQLKTWTVAYGASEFLIHFERAIMGDEPLSHVDRTLAFRGFLYANVNNCFGQGIPIEYGSTSTKEYEQNHILLQLPGSYAAGITNVLHTHSDSNGLISLSVNYAGEPNYSILEVESLIEPTLRPRLD